ncbi:guanine deaminase [Paracoccus sp. 1_MG-2023]|uniref:guanine deaminase n=1 Tax=unclassified Paracoccus (in: a-proteobacteria) TaxID=2688777 RepID=UPI001C083AA3|nr:MULTISPECIES: guanine deaminase [unclassified Paracoccus (in: a-proteobacteria)]MBU2956615.1 guanine deaminase [Paracoccus sp. C2R09]MDO6668721.1 guanine deaminase [Paracoccus sp. 1_MG-2023]
MRQLIRGRVLDFHADPNVTADNHRFFEDGAIVTRDGLIEAVGNHADLAEPDLPEIDHRPHLIMPGFIDPHIHFPQAQVIASWGAQLLDWLQNYTFPEEARFGDPDHAARIAGLFLDQLVANGTTTAVAFCSVHKTSAEALFTAAHARNMAMVAGKVMMDRNAIPEVHDTAQGSYDDSKALIEAWHGKGRQRYAITPRFAITSTPEQLAAAGTLAAEHPDCHVQTHLSENLAEIEFTLSLYPKARDYLDIYEQNGVLSDRLLLGHCIHLREREIARMAETGSRAIFCPTSNLFLGSGLFDADGLHEAGIVSGVATDVGGGTSWSMLQTLNEGYKVMAMRGQKLHPLAAFHWATRGNAMALGMEDRIGTLAPGSDADLVVLDAHATPAMALRSERIRTLSEELFILQIMGDDRAVAQTYVAGVAQKG